VKDVAAKRNSISGKKLNKTPKSFRVTWSNFGVVVSAWPETLHTLTQRISEDISIERRTQKPGIMFAKNMERFIRQLIIFYESKSKQKK